MEVMVQQLLRSWRKRLPAKECALSLELEKVKEISSSLVGDQIMATQRYQVLIINAAITEHHKLGPKQTGHLFYLKFLSLESRGQSSWFPLRAVKENVSHTCFPASGSLKQMAFSLILYIAVLLYLSLHVTRLFIRTPDRLDPRSTQLRSNLTLNNYTHSDPVYKSGMGGFGLNAGTWWWGGGDTIHNNCLCD